MEIKAKKAVSASEKINVTHIGPKQAYRLFIFSDVLEELVFYASQKNAWGLLSGQSFCLPVDKSQSSDAKMDKDCPESCSSLPKVDNRPADLNKKPDYVEISAFSDIYPCDDALDYASYLRKMRNFRNQNDNPLAGAVCLSMQKHEVFLEDLLLARSYFAGEKQAVFFVSADRTPPRAFILDETLDHFDEVGIEIVSAAGSELPFDLQDNS